jgi:AAA15 family ATPase/GTPase
MLTSLEIENFKGIGARQLVDFAPLTLLFGANSAGARLPARAY